MLRPILGENVKHFFLAGDFDNHSIHNYDPLVVNDIIRLPVGDHYESLTLKVFAGIHYIHKLYPDATIVKMDDDVEITNIPQFLSFVKDIQLKYHYSGFDLGQATFGKSFREFHFGKCNDIIINGSRWHGLYPKDMNYIGGPCYVLSCVAAKVIHDAFNDKGNHFGLMRDWYEDVAIAAYLSHMAGITPKLVPGKYKFISWS